MLNPRQYLYTVTISLVSSAALIGWFGPDLLLRGLHAFATVLAVTLSPSSLSEITVLFLQLSATSAILWSLSLLLFLRHPEAWSLPAYLGLVVPFVVLLVVLPPLRLLDTLVTGALFLPTWGVATAYCVRYFGSGRPSDVTR